MKDRPITTITKSITFDDRLFALMEADRQAEPEMDRSMFVRRLIEQRYYAEQMRPVSAAAEKLIKQIGAGKFKRVMNGDRYAVTRSISFDLGLIEVFDADRSSLPSRDRSQWVSELLEERFYGQKMRPISDAAQRELKQIIAGRR